MVVTFSSTQQITALTVAANTGQSIKGNSVQAIPNQPLSWVYRLTNTTWYAMAGGAARATAVVSGTSVASTSGTSIDFTGLPSWVKRITVMFNEVSSNGASNKLVQIGSGSVQSTGYIASGALIAQSTSGLVTSSTAGFIIWQDSAPYIFSGHMVLTLVSGSTWISSHYGKGATTLCNVGGGSVTLSGALDRVRITTVNGTDAFDAGTLNILYE
jgi:hypothetical protein